MLSTCRKSEWFLQGSQGVHFPGFETVRVGFGVTFDITSWPIVAASPLHPPSSTDSQIPTPRYARTSSHSSSRANQSPPFSQRCSPHTARTLRSQRSRYQLPPKRTRPSSQACFESLRMEHPYVTVPPLSTVGLRRTGAALELSYPFFYQLSFTREGETIASTLQPASSVHAFASTFPSPAPSTRLLHLCASCVLPVYL